MARLCVRVADNRHPTDAKLDALRTQIGDVVCIVDDGHVFSAAERNCGQYRFIDVPGVSQEALLALVASKFDANSVMTARRIVSLDATALKSGAWSSKTTATKTQIDAITITKA